MERLELQTTVRESTGNSPARSLRRSGHIPAILYGPKTDPVLLSVNIKDLEQVFKQGNVYQIILNLVIQNGKKITKAAMVKELQTHPLSGHFIHIDFYEIDMKRQINVMVPVITKGHPVGVENGGISILFAESLNSCACRVISRRPSRLMLPIWISATPSI